MSQPQEFFPPITPPRIYAYSDTRFAGCLKVGYTTKSVIERVREQYPVKTPEQSYTIVLDELAIRDDGSLFTDHDVHRVLIRKKIQRHSGECRHATSGNCQCPNPCRSGMAQIERGGQIDDRGSSQESSND